MHSLQAIETIQRFVFIMMKGGAVKKWFTPLAGPLVKRRSKFCLLKLARMEMQTDTELGYKCLIISLGVSVTWPKTTATQKGNTVATTTLKLSAQAKDLICKKTLQSSVWARLSGPWQWGGCRVSCEGRCQGLPVLVPDSSAAASTGITKWLRMEGTSGGHRVQPPCSSRTNY